MQEGRRRWVKGLKATGQKAPCGGDFTKSAKEKAERARHESDAEEAATDGSRTKNLAEKIEALREKRGRYGALLTELERSGEVVDGCRRSQRRRIQQCQMDLNTDS
jgi:hypothetical protein